LYVYKKILIYLLVQPFKICFKNECLHKISSGIVEVSLFTFFNKYYYDHIVLLKAEQYYLNMENTAFQD